MSNLYHDVGEPASDGKTKIMLATTAYDNPDASYTFSISKTREALHKEGFLTSYLLLQGNCHVDDARNAVVRDFLASDCDELVFLDADVSWEPKHLIELCGYECDLVGGVYPYRREGEGEKMPVRNLPRIFEPRDGLLEVEGLPTGFMRIKRHVLEALALHAETFVKDDGGPIAILFERDIWNGGRRGGDIGFCMKWRGLGGKLYAATELRLGHCGKHVIKDSLGASLRRQTGQSLRHVCDQIRAGKETTETFDEALKASSNPWGGSNDLLAASVALARETKSDILEIGSGLTTVLMAAATDQTVWCVEHDDFYAARTEEMARSAGVLNINICTAPIKGDWYDLAEMEGLPAFFDLAVVDGPPRKLGDRMQFFKYFGGICDLIVADDVDEGSYLEKVGQWAENNEREIVVTSRRTAVIKRVS